MGRIKKDLQQRFSFDGLYSEIETLFKSIADPRSYGCRYEFVNLLRMAFAIFSLKSPSMHSFQQRSKAEFHNLKKIFGITELCSDNCLRQGLDELNPNSLKAGFVRFYQLIKSYGFLPKYRYWGQFKLISIDGVEHFHSQKVHCSSCLTRTEKTGELHYTHSMLVAALVHPDQSEVFPLGCQAVIRQDGHAKNDCELNASKRLLDELKLTYPKESFLVLEDALFATGPHIDQLKAHQFSFIIGVKPNKSKKLFSQFEQRSNNKPLDQLSYCDLKGYHHHLRWVNNLPLNSTRADIRVNMLIYQQTSPRNKITTFSWITDRKILMGNAIKVMRAGRSRWKIENETFNTLKNQGYQFEHNFGHGYKNLATVFAIIMILAFCLDQAQQHAYKIFRLLWAGLKTKAKIWEALRAAFVMLKFSSMEELFLHIARQYQIQIDSS